MIQKLKKSDAGFTLVELIVVIAILGVLAAVLVPQYIQYVEKSRVASDKNTAATIEQAINVLLSDGSITNAGASGGGTGTVLWDVSAGTLTVTNITGITNSSITAITGTIPTAKSKVAADVTFTVSFASSIPSLTKSPDYTTWAA